MTAVLIQQVAYALIYMALGVACGSIVTFLVMSRHQERAAEAKVTAEFESIEDRWKAANEMAATITGEGRGGLHRRSPAVGKPPKLTPEPDPRAPEWPVNVARGTAQVHQSVWEQLDTIGAVLGGRMRSAADGETTGVLPPLPSEVSR